MTRSIPYVLLFILVITLYACSSCDERPKMNTELKERIAALEIQLDATEAQLLNIKTELSNCMEDRTLLKKNQNNE